MPIPEQRGRQRTSTVPLGNTEDWCWLTSNYIIVASSNTLKQLYNITQNKDIQLTQKCTKFNKNFKTKWQ